MKKFILRIITIVTIISVLTYASTTFAVDTSVDTLYAESVINEIANDNISYSIEKSIKLKSFEGDTSLFMFKLHPRGYAIYDASSNMVEEVSLCTNDLPYNVELDLDYYYGGPMNYYVKDNNKFINLLDDSTLDNEQLYKIQDRYDAIISSRKSRNLNTYNVARAGLNGTEYAINHANYFTSLLGNNFGNNVNGTCTHIASTILLRYYDYYINNNFVATMYESGVGTNEAFHQFLQNNYFGITPVGLATASEKLNIYFSDRNVNATASAITGSHTSVYSRVRTQISNNRPLIAAMFASYNNACTMDHTVVVYSYTVVKLGSVVDSIYYTVHNGWYSDHTATYSYDWFADALYFNV